MNKVFLPFKILKKDKFLFLWWFFVPFISLLGIILECSWNNEFRTGGFYLFSIPIILPFIYDFFVELKDHFAFKKEFKFSLHKIYTAILSLIIVISCFILKMTKLGSNVALQIILVMLCLFLSFYIYLENKMDDYLDDSGNYLRQESASINKIDKNSKVKEVKTRNGGKAKI